MANSKMKRGDVFNEWTVLDPSRRLTGRMRPDGTARSRAAALARCSCGTEKVIHQDHLRSGNTKSCGHYRESNAWRPARPERMTLKARIKCDVDPEALRDRAVIRRTLHSIKDRCLNPGSTAYPNYGGRGVTLWEPWRDDPEAFTGWVLENLGPRPEGHSIDRADVNGNYEPGNIRWATQAQQMQNTRAQLDPMNGVVRTPGASTFGYSVTRNGEKFAEYGFATREGAAAGRDGMLAVFAGRGPDAARELIGSRTRERADARSAAAGDARRAARDVREAATQAARDARQAERDADAAERAARRQAKAGAKSERARRWHEMNKAMTLSAVARAEGVSVACVSLELKHQGYDAITHNATGFPGVKKVTKGGRTYYEARAVIDGKRKTLGQRKTPEEAHALYLAARHGRR
jgi:hypothetical protein